MLRKIIASLIFVIFVLASVPFFLGLTLGKTFLSSSFYQGTLLDTAYEPLVGFITDNIRSVDPVFTTYFSPDEVKARVETYFTKDVLRQVVSDSFDQFNKNVNSPSLTLSDSKNLRLKIQLVPLVQASQGFLREMVESSLNKIPQCRSDEKPIMTHIFPSCTLAVWQAPEFKEKFKGEFERAYQDKVFKQFSGGNGDFSYDLRLGMSKDRYLSFSQNLDYAFIYMAAFLIAFTVILLLTWMRRWDIGLRWTGSMWMTSAVLGAIFCIFIFFADHFIPASSLSVPESSVAYTQSLTLIHIFSVAFAKVYALFLFFAFLIGLFFFTFARKFDALPHDSL